MNEKAIFLKDKINKGDICVGAVTSAYISRDELKRIVETGEYDYLSIDSQHAPYPTSLSLAVPYISPLLLKKARRFLA